MAGAEILQHLSQVYDAAMAGFAHNPKWKQVHAILIIGAFFTQVVWSTHPELRGPGGTIARAQEQARALGYRFPEDEAKPATPTPPNSVAEERFKGGVKNVKSLPKPHMVTRKKSLQTILAIHDKAGDEDSSGDEDGEGEGDG